MSRKPRRRLAAWLGVSAPAAVALMAVVCGIAKREAPNTTPPPATQQRSSVGAPTRPFPQARESIRSDQARGAMPLLGTRDATVACGQMAEKGVQLTLHECVGVGRDGESVTSGAPLPEGAVKAPGDLALSDLAGQPVPCQSAPLCRWPDGSLKWVLLDFQGWYANQPDQLQKKMKQIAPRIARRMPSDPQAHVCPSAYENVDTRDLIEPPSHKLVGIAIALVGLLVTNIVLYRQGARDLSRALDRMLNTERVLADGAATAKENR